MRRAAVLLIALLLLSPIWLASKADLRVHGEVAIERLEAPEADRAGPAGFDLVGLWNLRAPNMNFGGYSAMLPLSDGRLRLFSDRGWVLTMTAPDHLPRSFETEQAMSDAEKPRQWYDMESVTRDPASGRYWVGFEDILGIQRYGPDGRPDRNVRPAFMSNWAVNGGPEAMARLSDGRFVVLRETEGEGYIYDGDPVEGAAFERFTAAYPEGFDPVDMVQLPDGRVLILMRALNASLPPFKGLLMLADPPEIRPGSIWRPKLLMRLEHVLPRENWEGLAVVPRGDGTLDLWLCSDSNNSVLQRTLLARFRWDPRVQSVPEL